MAAFLNYPECRTIVLAARTTQGEPAALLVAADEQIITGYVDLLSWEGMPNRVAAGRRRLARLLAALRRLSRARWLLVHDAAECECWLDQGFVLVPPPVALPVERAVQVLSWRALPQDVYRLLAARGLEWRSDLHRRVVRSAPERDEGFASG
jgi:hypothetical protein